MDFSYLLINNFQILIKQNLKVTHLHRPFLRRQIVLVLLFSYNISNNLLAMNIIKGRKKCNPQKKRENNKEMSLAFPNFYSFFYLEEMRLLILYSRVCHDIMF